MFEINNQFKINSSLPIIAENYEILHFDEFPILFTGINKYANKLLGSFSYENHEENYSRYFVIIIDDEQYSDFLTKRKTYLQLINETNEIFVCDRTINNEEIAVYHLPLSYIPNEYLPSIDSYVPDKKGRFSLSYSFSLKGKLAEYHKALLSDINSVSGRIFDFLQESFVTFSDLSLMPVIYSQPSQKSSYRLNFDIEFKNDNQIRLFEVNHEKLTEFINGFFDYVANQLPSEREDFLNTDPTDSMKFNLIKAQLESVYESASLLPAKTLGDKLTECINNSAIKLSNVTEYLKDNESFKYIELGNFISNKIPPKELSYLTDSYKSTIENKLFPKDPNTTVTVSEIDNDTKEYRILVYRLNTDNGTGAAKLYYKDENFHRVYLHVKIGDKQILNSVYTNSLNEGKVSSIIGRATKVDGIFKKLECEL